ncbi:hypothetical protein C4D60_Mb05t14840 [Musa balbisiana]|uniref:Uncharacterized protein n=1 Tax=Musa balbisiana TaxID=52838 RepID=A0A4S8JW66_MUSBA|nr:hypothetical protein C4D60_Mb05t14840 [Musa balbisiana]
MRIEGFVRVADPGNFDLLNTTRGRDWAEFGSPSLCFLRAGLRRGRSIIYESPADEPCAAGVCRCAGDPQKLFI